MASLKEIQAETMATIDTGKAMIDKVLTIMNIMVSMPSLSLTLSANPMAFLLQLLEHAGITYEDLKAFLTDFLIYTLPALELGVKAILLTNLKTMVSCSIDPRIPDQYRKRHKSVEERNTPNEYGIDIDIESIDFLDKLSFSPLSDYGRDMYFGQAGVLDVYKFARADDFDAFLWFVMHKGKFPMTTDLDLDLSGLNNRIHGSGTYKIQEENPTLFKELNLTPYSNDPEKEPASTILPGNTFGYKKESNNPNIISMCIDTSRDEENRIVHNTLVPISDDLTSANWYIRRKDQLTSNIFGNDAYASRQREYVNGKKRTTGVNMSAKTRDYSKEKAICNLQYLDTSYGDQNIVGLANNKFRFTILPKPYIHIPDVSNGEPPWRFIKMTFDADGNYDLNGKYTIPATTKEEIDLLNERVVFVINDEEVAVMGLKSGNVKVVVDEGETPRILKYMFECYGGLTVYEFNYDYVMGMKLFDAKVMASTLLQTLVNTRLGIDLSLEAKHREATERIKEIIKSIVNSDDGEINDCFFSFDNSKYDSLLRDAEAKRAKRQTFGNVTRNAGLFDSVNDILKEYDTATDLHDRKEALSRAIQQAAVIISEGSEDEDEYSIQYSFVFDLIENLVMAIMNAVLSPKVLMLLEVNQRLMGGTWKMLTKEDLLRAMSTIIEAIVKEIRDLILQELLKLLMKQLQPIVELIGSIVIRERLEYYSEVINNILKNCPFIWFSFGSQLLETKLDTVDYADIDVSSTKKGEKPTTNPC